MMIRGLRGKNGKRAAGPAAFGDIRNNFLTPPDPHASRSGGGVGGGAPHLFNGGMRAKIERRRAAPSAFLYLRKMYFPPRYSRTAPILRALGTAPSSSESSASASAGSTAIKSPPAVWGS